MSTLHLSLNELAATLALLEADLEQQRYGTALHTRYNLACEHLRSLIASLKWHRKEQPVD